MPCRHDEALFVIGGSLSPSLSVRPGVLKLKDLSGDGIVTADDRTIIGSALPDYQGGFGINATYKSFDFATFFNYVVGNDVYNTGKIQYNMLYRTTYGNMLNTMNYDNRFKYIDANGALVNNLEQLRQLNANATMWSPFSMVQHRLYFIPMLLKMVRSFASTTLHLAIHYHDC